MERSSVRFDSPSARAAIEWCQHLRELQVRLGGAWVHADQRRRRSSAPTLLDAAISLDLRSLWNLVDPAVKEIVRLTMWKATKPEKSDSPYDPALLSSADQERLLRMSEELFGKDARKFFGPPWAVKISYAEQYSGRWTPTSAAAWCDSDLADRVAGTLFDDLLQVSDQLAIAFADEYMFVELAHRVDEPLTFLMTRRRHDWFVLTWPALLQRWTDTPEPGGGADPTGVREPRTPVIPPMSEKAEGEWPPTA